MNAREERALARLDNAAGELRLEHMRLADAPPMYEAYVAKLLASVKRLHELEYEQHSVKPEQSLEGFNTTFLRKRLRREYMIPLARIGKPLFRFAPGVEKVLKVPHARASHRELVASAEAILQWVRPHQKLLASAGFPKTFFTELRDLTAQLKRVATTSSARQVKFGRVTRAFRKELAAASDTLRILDGLLLRRTDRDKDFARLWKRALRTPKRLGRPPAKRTRRPLPNEEVPHSGWEEPRTG